MTGKGVKGKARRGGSCGFLWGKSCGRHLQQLWAVSRFCRESRVASSALLLPFIVNKEIRVQACHQPP